MIAGNKLIYITGEGQALVDNLTTLVDHYNRRKISRSLRAPGGGIGKAISLLFARKAQISSQRIWIL